MVEIKLHSNKMEEYESVQIKHIVAISVKQETTTESELSSQKKTPRKKLTSQNENWINTANSYSTQETQQDLLNNILSSDTQINNKDQSHANILLTHLKTKQSGYRSQDTIKGFYDPDRFIQIPDMVKLLAESNLSCFYCRKWATLFYENVREPRQWSLERLSNAEGHNRDNVVIACLECNMRRRTMYYERYIATKQLKVNKLEG